MVRISEHPWVVTSVEFARMQLCTSTVPTVLPWARDSSVAHSQAVHAQMAAHPRSVVQMAQLFTAEGSQAEPTPLSAPAGLEPDPALAYQGVASRAPAISLEPADNPTVAAISGEPLPFPPIGDAPEDEPPVPPEWLGGAQPLMDESGDDSDSDTAEAPDPAAGHQLPQFFALSVEDMQQLAAEDAQREFDAQGDNPLVALQHVADAPSGTPTCPRPDPFATHTDQAMFTAYGRLMEPRTFGVSGPDMVQYARIASMLLEFRGFTQCHVVRCMLLDADTMAHHTAWLATNFPVVLAVGDDELASALGTLQLGGLCSGRQTHPRSLAPCVQRAHWCPRWQMPTCPSTSVAGSGL
jgi:hypothetical protein